MKKDCIRSVFFLSIFALLFLSSCDKEDSFGSYSYNESTIYSSSNKFLFSEVVFFVKPYVMKNGEKKYIISDALYNNSLKINNGARKMANSYQLDTLHLYNKETIGNYRVTTDIIRYPVVINIRVSYTPATAGGYSDLLNNFLTLPPGTYVCQIESFDIKTADGNLQTIYTPVLFLPLNVEENSVSANLGELEVEIKQ